MRFSKILLTVTVLSLPVTAMSDAAFAQQSRPGGAGASSTESGGGSDPNRSRYPRCTPTFVAKGYECEGVSEQDCSCTEYVVRRRDGLLERREQCHEFVGNPLEYKVKQVRTCENPHVRG